MEAKAKDTVITDEVTKLAMSDIKNRWLHSTGRKTTFEHDCIEEIISTNRQIQADVSFKAGVKEGYEQLKSEYDEDMKQHRLACIKEVVDWVNLHAPLERCDPDVMPYFTDYLELDYYDWQVQVEKWEKVTKEGK